MTAVVEVSIRYLPRRGLSDSLMTATVEVTSHYLQLRTLSDGLLTAPLRCLVVTCHVGVLATVL